MKRTLNGIDYHYIDPTGNITILVESQVPVEEQPEVAKILMERERSCEQVGYVGTGGECDITLRMAAGEFCGNATMSAAALFCDKAGLGVNETRTVTARSSGCRERILVDITRDADKGSLRVYGGSVHMPHHKGITKHALKYGDREYDLPVVAFEGIMHIIAKSDDLDMSDTEAEEAVRIWCKELGAKCLGIMIVSEDMTSLRPLVYVPAIGSCFWERSCASGTTATGAYCFENGLNNGPVISFSEPGGVLSVTKDSDGGVILTGKIVL